MNTPQVSEAEREQRFARLQERLPGVGAETKRKRPDESIVVVPSVVPADADTDRCCKHRRNVYSSCSFSFDSRGCR